MIGRSQVALTLAITAVGCPGRQPSPPPTASTPVPCLGDSDGFQEPPASGVAFLIDRSTLAGPESGLDVNGDGRADGMLNRAWGYGRTNIDATLMQEIESGRQLSALEIAGLCAPFSGNDPAVTLKLYDAMDVDGDPTTTFCGDRERICSQLAVPRYALSETFPYRTEPGSLTAGRAVFSGEAPLPFAIGPSTSLLLSLHHSLAAVTLPADLSEIDDGMVCGTLTVAALADMALARDCPPAAFCLTARDADDPSSLSAADRLALPPAYQPDVDLDGDGLERYQVDFFASPRTVTCHDGDGSLVAEPDCLHSGRMADGFSICFSFHAVGAVLVISD